MKTDLKDIFTVGPGMTLLEAYTKAIARVAELERINAEMLVEIAEDTEIRDRYRKALENAARALESQGGFYIGSPTHRVIVNIRKALNP